MPDLEIRASKNGPYRLPGGRMILVDAQGNERVIERPRPSLCRCGQSKDKPLCDGTHRSCGFTADEVLIRWSDTSEQQA